jgi:hypothetical protein
MWTANFSLTYGGLIHLSILKLLNGWEYWDARLNSFMEPVMDTVHRQCHVEQGVFWHHALNRRSLISTSDQE